jgi:hypothetical protein
MPENSSCFIVRSFTFLYAVKGLFSGTGRFFQHRGMEKVPCPLPGTGRLFRNGRGKNRRQQGNHAAKFDARAPATVGPTTKKDLQQHGKLKYDCFLLTVYKPLFQFNHTRRRETFYNC